MYHFRSMTVALILLGATPSFGATKAGVAKVDITPEGPIWMSGYASRNKPSQGVVERLWARALAIDDGSGKPLVLVSTDIIGLPQSMSDRISATAASKFDLERSRLVLNSSHTHTGPMIHGNLSPMAPKDEDNQARIRAYAQLLHDRVIDAIGGAIGSMENARLSFDFGKAGFATNRRVKTPKGYVIGVNPDGPVDHRVPVMRVTRSNGRFLALLYGYACHNTTLTGEFYEISGDYSGFASKALETEFPGAVALFFTLCAGDQNPEPRSTLDLARNHGQALAAEVSRVSRTRMNPVEGRVKTAFRMTRLPLENLQQVDYPVQAVRFKKGFTLLALGGEVVVDYSILFTGMWPKEPLVVAAYSNAVMGYIPSKRVLDEGGYEAGDSMKWYGLPARFAADVEERVKDAAADVMARVK